MRKKLFFVVSNGDDSATAELSGCMEWIKGDLEANWPNAESDPEEDRPQYTLDPVWLTDEEFNNLPEAE
jgi:hypothetical protein